MKRIILTLRKLRAEMGFNVIRLLPGLGGVLANTLRPPYKDLKRLQTLDRALLLQPSFRPGLLLEKARFFSCVDSGPALPVFQEISNADRQDRWRWTSSRLAYLATVTWPDVENPSEQLDFLSGKPDAYYRYHELNQGSNDHWEYYLVPWHRTYGRLTIALLDPRLRPILLPIWHRYDAWYRSERPWMTRLVVGSNIASVLTGYTMHSLMGFLLHTSREERLKSLDRYFFFSRKLRRALANSYDGRMPVAVPFEGVLYGSFWWRSTIVLGLIQRALGLAYCVLDEPSCRSLSKYVWRSRTSDGDFQTSGDSKALRAGAVPEDNVFPILSALGNDEYADRLADMMAEPYFLRDRIHLPI